MRSQRSVYRDAVRTVEIAIGRLLKGQERVHHVDENPWNNAHENLVVCPNQSYHKLLHVRQEAYNATGNANMRACDLCSIYDKPENMTPHVRKERNGSLTYRHKACNAAYARNFRRNR